MTNVVTLKTGGQIAGIVPQSFEDVYRLSRCISESGLAPAGMTTPEQVTVAIMTGLELGLPPMFAIQKIAVINGRPALWGDAIPALLWGHAFKLKEWIDGDINTDNATAFCQVIRPDGESITRTFSKSDAIKAGLWQTAARVKKKGKDGSFYEKDNDSPWFKYPQRMLQMRARGYACRDGAADVLSGLYIAEELEQPMRDVTPAADIPALEIPDIPDAPTEAEASQEPASTIADPDGVVAKIEEDIALCTSAEELAEIAEANKDLIERLPKGHRYKAEKVLKDAAE